MLRRDFDVFFFGTAISRNPEKVKPTRQVGKEGRD
jgi:hypothetical protein